MMLFATMLLTAIQMPGYTGGPPPRVAAAQGAARAALEARAFLVGVYAGYARPGGRGAPLTQPARLFEPTLAAAIAGDQARSDRRNEVGRLDFDPFCAGQDWDPFTPRIGPLAATGDRATATVSFRNGRPVSIRFELVRTPGGWRIWDMHGPDHLTSLRALMLRPAPARRRRTGDDAVD